MQRPHGLDQRQRASREDAVGTPGDSVAHLDDDVAEPEDAVAHARGRDRVRDEGDPAARGAPDDPSRLVGEVVPVQDDLHDDVVAGERGAGDAGIAVLERPHRVEEVRDGGGAAVERPPSLARRWRRSDRTRRRHPARCSASMSSSAPSSSGASVIVDTGPASSRRASSAASGSRRADAGCAPSRLGERKGPSRWAPITRGPIASRGTSASAATRSASGRRDQGRLERRDAASRAGLRRHAGSPRASAEAKSTPPMPLTCRSTSPGIAMPRPGAPFTPDRRDPAVDDLDVAAQQQRRRRPRPRRPSLIGRSLQSARGSRRRPHRAAGVRSRASTPASRETIATFVSPSAATSAASISSSVTAVASSTARRARARSLELLATTSTIRLPYVRPRRTIGHGRDRVQHELLRGAGLHPRRAGDHLGADDGDDRRGRPCRPSSVCSAQTTPTVAAPAATASRTAPRTYGVRPLAESATTASFGPTPTCLEVGRAGALVVLGRLLRLRPGRGAAGDDGDHAAVADAERRAALGGVDGREPAGACRRRRRSAGRRSRSRSTTRRSRRRAQARCRADRGRDPGVLVVDQLDELERRDAGRCPRGSSSRCSVIGSVVIDRGV